MSDTQTVVYRSCVTERPKWNFYSMPQSVVGGADDLSSAQDRYRDALAFSLDVPTRHLPEIRELAEYEAGKGTGIWIRGELASSTLEVALEFLTNFVVNQPEADREWLCEHVASSGDAIIVPAEPDTPLGSITSQMTSFDALWIAMKGSGADGNNYLMWLALGGVRTDTPSDVDKPINLTDLGLTAESPMGDVFAAFMSQQGLEAASEGASRNFALVGV